MNDEVRYALPLGPLGRLMHAVRVKCDLAAIFDHQARRINKIFGAGGR